jgi:hypothetical protein
MKSWAWAAICISVVSLGAMSGAAGCSSDDPAGDGDDDGEGGSGSGGTGSGATTGSGPTTGSGTTTGTGSPASSGTGSTSESCDDIGVCDGENSCLVCSIVGDPADFSDGGECESAYSACFGTDDMCTGGDADCCAFDACVAACPMDDAATPDVDENLDCLCTNNGTQCEMASMPGTCVGDHPDGFAVYLPFVQCVLDVCATSCGG